MKFATKIKILIVLAVCMIATLISGCSVGQKTWDKFLKEQNAYDKCVTYSASGGIFNDNANRILLNVYYKEENEAILDDFSSANGLSIKRSGYVFNGWVYAQLDSDGNPVYDEKGYLVPTDDAVDTSVPVTLTAGQHLYVCAVWVLDVRVDVILVIDGDTDKTKEITGADGNKYKTGDPIDSKIFTTGGTVTINSSTSSTASTDYTFLQYYKDEACNEVMSGTITRPEDGVNPKVYAKYIEGVWTVVRNSSQAASMLNNPVDGAKYYLYTDDGSKIIDCSRNGFSLKRYNSGNPFKVNCTIAGNGVTIKNLDFKTTTVNQGQICSIFGVFGSNADISDLTIENIKVAINARGSITAYLVGENIEDGAKLNNVTISDASLAITISASNTINNIQKVEDSYDTSNWICGGGVNSITVNGATLTINGEAVVE